MIHTIISVVLCVCLLIFAVAEWKVIYLATSAIWFGFVLATRTAYPLPTLWYMILVIAALNVFTGVVGIIGEICGR